MILGQDVFSTICPIGYSTSDKHLPWAVQLPIGWVVSGPLPDCKQLKVSCCMFSSTETNSDKSNGCAENLSSQVSKWWALESYSLFVNVQPRSKSDKHALKILNATSHFNGSRYSVRMLRQAEHIKLPKKFGQAKAHLSSLERRLEKIPEIKALYAEFKKTDLDKGYVRNLTLDEVKSSANSQQRYLPHHPVQKPHKPDKLRCVCNAACRFSGTSLDGVLLLGPDLLCDLIGVLIRFRLFLIAVCGDIEAMFMQVEVPVHEQNFLRFLWREGVSDEIEVFQYTRHIFGAKSWPTCANFAVQQVASDNKDDFPQAAEAVFDSFYVDDFVKSFESVNKAIEVMTQEVEMMKRNGLNLTKFITNRSVGRVYLCPRAQRGFVADYFGA